MQSITATNDFVIKFANVNGSGSASANTLFGNIRFLGSLEANRPLVVAFAEAIAQAERNDLVRAQMAAFYEETRGAIAAAAREAFGDGGRGSDVDFRTVAAMIIAMFDGLMIQFLVDPEHFLDLAQLATSAQTLLDLLEITPVHRPATSSRAPGARHR